MKKEKLLERAQELEIQVPEGATNAQIEDLIKIAEHPMLKEAVETASNEFAKLEVEKKEATDQVADLTQKLSDANAAKDTLQNELNAKNEELETANQKLAKAEAASQMNLKVEKGSKKSSELPTYGSGDETWQFTVNKLITSAGKITAEEAVKDNDLMEQLIKSKFFGLKKL